MTADDPASYVETNPDDLVALARNLVPINSVNPPGHTRAIAGYVETHPDPYGVDAERFAVDPAKPNVVVRLPGDEGNAGGENDDAVLWFWST